MKNRRIISTALLYQVALEGTCQEKTRKAWTKIKENVLAHGKKIGPVDTQ
jgi:hypothetical protein